LLTKIAIFEENFLIRNFDFLKFDLIFLNLYLDEIRLYWERDVVDLLHQKTKKRRLFGGRELEPTIFGTFNLCIFGASKYNKTLVKDYIIKILSRYDVCTVQASVKMLAVLIKDF